MVDEIFDFLKMNDVKYKKDVKLSKISTVLIKEMAKILMKCCRLRKRIWQQPDIQSFRATKSVTS